MGKGYAEGPAAEERFAALERGELGGTQPEAPDRAAVFGATPDDASKHFIGWADEVDTEALFESGAAWGLSIVRRPAETP